MLLYYNIPIKKPIKLTKRLLYNEAINKRDKATLIWLLFTRAFHDKWDARCRDWREFVGDIYDR